jgi:hypothetical protein
MVVNALSAMNPYTIVSSQVFPSSDFVSLVKTVIEIGGTKSDVWLMVVPESALNQTFLVSDSIVKGDGVNFIAGMPGLTYSGTPFYFALDLDRTALNVYVKNEATRASSASNQQLLDVGADDTWLYSIPLHADVPGSRVTIQATQMLKSHFGIPVQTWDRQLAMPTLSRIVSAACFPRNCRLDIELATTVGATMTSGLSLTLLPQSRMMSRLADKRIGYFETAFTDIGVHSASESGARGNEIDKDYHFIHKWNLVKSGDCSGKLCEPVVPIVYHIDPTVPKRWRPYMKKAVELWQPAFEALGFANTPRARLPEDSDWPADYDSVDIRYSSIRMGLMHDGATAIGPTTVDPRTGEILDADVSFPLSWVSVFAGKYWPDMTVLDLPSGQGSRVPEEAKTSLRRNSDHRRLSRNHQDHRRGCAFEHFHQAAATTSQQMRGLAADASDGRVPFKIIADGLTEVAVHEVGHTLGLRHNFKGSTLIPFTKIYDGDYTSKHGKSSSIMDYTAAVIAPTKAQQDTAIVFPGSRTIGAYDKHAIKYGYQVVEDEKWNEQHADLVKTADEMASLGLEFATDEDAPGFLNTDQLNKRYDLTDDPVSWVNDQYKIAARMIKHADTQIAWDGSTLGYEASGNYLISALQLSVKRTQVLVNLLGGTTLDKQFPSKPLPSTPTKPLVRVMSSAYQWYLLDVLLSFVTNPDYRKISSTTQSLASTGYFYSTAKSPIRKMYDLYIGSGLDMVLSPTKLAMVANTHYVETNGGDVWSPPSWKVPPASKPTLSPFHVVERVGKAIFGFENGAPAQLWKSTVEWPLQTRLVNRLVNLYNTTMHDAAYVEVAVDVGRAIDSLRADVDNAIATEVQSLDVRTAQYLNRTSAVLQKATEDWK